MVEWWAEASPLNELEAKGVVYLLIFEGFSTYMKASRLITKLRIQPAKFEYIVDRKLVDHTSWRPFTYSTCTLHTYTCTHVHTVECSVYAMSKSASETNEWVAL